VGATCLRSAIYSGDDTSYPKSHTCFFQTDMPLYSSKEIMRKQVLFAIKFYRTQWD